MARFSEKVIGHKMCLILSTDFSETSLVVRRNERDIIIVYWFSCKVPVILVRF